MIVTLKFVNRDASSGDVEMQISRDAVRDVMAWYGAYYSGDDYDVLINGRRQNLDINGELEADTVDGVVVRNLIA